MVPDRLPLVLVLGALGALGACDATVATDTTDAREVAPTGDAQSAATSPAMLHEIRALLRAPDLVVDEARLAAIGSPAAVVTVLERLLDDPATSRYERTRIVSALRVLDDPRVEPILEGMLDDDATSVFVRRVAIKVYARRAGARALPRLARFMDDDDRHTRESVLRALGGIDDARARSLLRVRADKEEAADLRALARRLGQ